MIKTLAEKFVAQLIDELEGGFQNGFDDVLAFAKPNITQLLKIAAEPKQASLITMFGVPPIMNFINHCYNNKNQIIANDKRESAQKQTEPKSDAPDVEMQEETKVEVGETLQ